MLFISKVTEMLLQVEVRSKTEQTKAGLLVLMLFLCHISRWSQTGNYAAVLVFQGQAIRGKQLSSVLIKETELKSLKLGSECNYHLMLSQSPWLLLIYFQSLGCIRRALQSTLRYYSFLQCGLTAVSPLPVCSHHGSTCPIFLRVSADKVTGLIDVSLQSPPLCTGSTPISISEMLERRAPVGTKDITAIPHRPPDLSLP